MEQGTDEWLMARCGKATASRIADIMAKTKTGFSVGRKNYEAQLIAERLTNEVAASFTNAAMKWGTDTEPQARAAYEFERDCEVKEFGFVSHRSIKNSGASPDGLVGDDGLIEIKCPNTATHLDTLLTKKIPKKYQTQMFWQMACCERQWCDFVSYDPRLPANMSMIIIRLDRDDQVIEEMEEAVHEFLKAVDDKVHALGVLYK